MTRLIKSGWRNRKWVGISILSLTALGLILWQLPAIVDGYISTRDLLIRSLAFSIFPPLLWVAALGAGDMEETLTAGNTPLESLGGRSAGNACYMGSPGLLLGLYRRAGGVQPGRVDWPEHKGFLRRAGRVPAGRHYCPGPCTGLSPWLPHLLQVGSRQGPRLGRDHCSPHRKAVSKAGLRRSANSA